MRVVDISIKSAHHILHSASLDQERASALQHHRVLNTTHMMPNTPGKELTHPYGQHKPPGPLVAKRKSILNQDPQDATGASLYTQHVLNA